MNNGSPETLKSQPNLSVQDAGEMFSTLFENPENLSVVAELFKGLPGIAREQQIQETIKLSKSGLQNLKNTV